MVNDNAMRAILLVSPNSEVLLLQKKQITSSRQTLGFLKFSRNESHFSIKLFECATRGLFSCEQRSRQWWLFSRQKWPCIARAVVDWLYWCHESTVDVTDSVVCTHVVSTEIGERTSSIHEKTKQWHSGLRRLEFGYLRYSSHQARCWIFLTVHAFPNERVWAMITVMIQFWSLRPLRFIISAAHCQIFRNACCIRLGAMFFFRLPALAHGKVITYVCRGSSIFVSGFALDLVLQRIWRTRFRRWVRTAIYIRLFCGVRFSSLS